MDAASKVETTLIDLNFSMVKKLCPKIHYDFVSDVGYALTLHRHYIPLFTNRPYRLDPSKPQKLQEQVPHLATIVEATNVWIVKQLHVRPTHRHVRRRTSTTKTSEGHTHDFLLLVVNAFDLEGSGRVMVML